MFSKYAIALTGSIATGKSTACTMLKLLGFHIIDTDAIAHQLLEQHAVQVQDLFVQNILSHGKVDRKTLGKIVFNDQEKLRMLESFLHPLIMQEVVLQASQKDRFKKPYLIDIPLFFERGNYDMQRSIVVYTTPKQQLQRLMQRDGLDLEAAKKRIALQMDIETKKQKATYVIDNTKDINHLHLECQRVKEELLKDVCQ